MKPVNILLAEDNRGDVFLVREALTKHLAAYNLSVVRDGEHAIDYVSAMGQPGAEPCPDVLLLDLNLPRATGSEILSAFRQHPDCKHTPVIVVTSSDAAADRERVSQFRVSCYFRKPSDYEAFMHLGAIVKQLLEAA